MNSGLMPKGSRAQNNSRADGVPEREREHAAQPGQHVGAPVVVAGDDGLAVAVGGEDGAVLGGQLVAQLQVVVDLAVEHQHVAVGGVSGGPQRSGWCEWAMSMMDSRLKPNTTAPSASGRPTPPGSSGPRWRIRCDARAMASSALAVTPVAGRVILGAGRIGHERQQSTHGAPVCRTWASLGDAAPGRSRRDADWPVGSGRRAERRGLRCVVFDIRAGGANVTPREQVRSQRLSQGRFQRLSQVAFRRRRRPLALAATLGAAGGHPERMQLVGGAGPGLAGGHHPAGPRQPAAVDRSGDRLAGRRGHRVGPDVLVVGLPPQEGHRHRTAPPVRLQHAAGAGAHRDAVPDHLGAVLLHRGGAGEDAAPGQGPRGRDRRHARSSGTGSSAISASTSKTARSPTTAPTRRARRRWSPSRRARTRAARSWSGRSAGSTPRTGPT